LSSLLNLGPRYSDMPGFSFGLLEAVLTFQFI
jgi:hypothetical protein